TKIDYEDDDEDERPRKNRVAMAQVASLNSSSGQPFTCAATSEISFTYAGSQRLPRYGTGARYGQSVSNMNWPMGVAANVSRMLCPFLKVKIPVKLTSEPRARMRRMVAPSFA